jgi:hypothetical protein
VYSISNIKAQGIMGLKLKSLNRISVSYSMANPLCESEYNAHKISLSTSFEREYTPWFLITERLPNKQPLVQFYWLNRKALNE